MFTLESLWKEYKSRCVKNTSAQQVAFEKAIFYAGIAAVIDMQLKLSNRSLSFEEICEIAKGWDKEILAFQNELIEDIFSKSPSGETQKH